MLLKFTYNARIDNDANVNVSSEQIVDSETEADEAGELFRKLMFAFIAGFSREHDLPPS